MRSSEVLEILERLRAIEEKLEKKEEKTMLKWLRNAIQGLKGIEPDYSMWMLGGIF